MNKQKNFIKNIRKTIKELEGFSLYKIDYDRKLLKKAFNIAYKNGLYDFHKYPTIQTDSLKFKLFRKITPYSGALAFLSIQILAANAIMNKNNFKRKEHFFKKKCGIAINHLRSNETIVEAKKCKNGYKLNGQLSWASGYKIFDRLLIGFHFENKEYEVLTKFKKQKGFKIIDTPKTFVGYSLNTVNIELKDFFVEEKNIVSSNDKGNYNKNKSLSKTVHYALYGIGIAAIPNIENKKLKKESQKRINKLKNSFLQSKDKDHLDFLRIELFNCVLNTISTAMILNGGKSILLEKNLQRFYRELIMFNSNGLNSHLKNLFLKKFL
ncbi:hypothetical protein CP965_12635 [Halarcobacter mediterraneus]|uniref:Acyl-CoA dehydrogenase n=1 Tax=Halarcobacter mediterraneus TaxID=2023153 RepID=A0A4Q1ASM8_9BACT|nr:hypothetical protein [Halarcobacter mediterraneus]RXK11611.1 hypothetical protein CP965_12635 [Halarcobacter mediterraneus]